MRRLVKPIDRYPPHCGADRPFVVRAFAQTTDQAIQRADVRPAQSLTLHELPVVKTDAVSQSEAGKEVVPVEPYRPAETRVALVTLS